MCVTSPLYTGQAFTNYISEVFYRSCGVAAAVNLNYCYFPRLEYNAGQDKETDIVSVCRAWRQALQYSSVQELYLESGEWVFLSGHT